MSALNDVATGPPRMLGARRVQVGAATLLVPGHGSREVDTVDLGGRDQRAVEWPAIATAAQGTSLELSHQRWLDGGQVLCVGRTDSPPVFDRIIGRTRLGIQTDTSGVDWAEIRLLDWDPRRSWGSLVQAAVADLDQVLAADSADLLVRSGAFEMGQRRQVLGDSGRRRNYLAATFPVGDPVVPLVVFNLTRVLPIIRSRGSGV